MRGRSIRRTTCLLAALAILASIATAQPIPEPGLTRVVSLTGTLTVTRLRQDPWLLRLHDAVQSGDELATGENSQAVLRSADGSTVVVYPDSRLVFNERSADVRELLHLFLGSIKVHIERISGRPNPHKMTTPTAVIAVRGTTFSVFVDDTDSTLIAVEEGEVAVANTQLPGQEVVLRAGQRTWVRPGQLPQQARAFRGRSERADLAQGMGRGREAAGMQQMDTMMGSRGMGAMSARTNPH